MADIPSVPPSAPPVTPAVPAGNVTPIEARVSNSPDKIQQLARQIQVSGTLTQIPINNELSINTILGTLTIVLPILAEKQQQKLIQQLNQIFQYQKPITVVVQPGNPPTQAFLLLPPVTNAPPKGSAEANILLQTLNASKQPLVPGTVLPAVVLPPLPTSASSGSVPPLPQTPSAPQAPSSPPLTSFLPNLPEIPISIEEIVLKAQASVEKNVAKIQQQFLSNVLPQSSLAPQSIPLPPQVAAPLTGNVATLLQSGNEVMLKVEAVVLPPPSATASLSSSGAALPLPVPQANQILATVMSAGPNGQLVLQAGNTTLYVKDPVDAPVGSTLLLTVDAAKGTTASSYSVPDVQNFSSLPQILSALNQIDPQLARQVIENHIPQPNTALSGALLFFMSAFKQGGIRNWLGNDALEALTRGGKMELIAKLTQELTSLSQSARDPVVGEWRSYPVPLFNNNQFHIVNFYVHSDGRRGDTEQDSKARINNVRFLIDVQMSKLGALQLDGLAQPKKLDILVRSENALPGFLHQDLRQTYIKALGSIDYTGAINFQVGRQHWMVLRKGAAAGAVA